MYKGDLYSNRCCTSFVLILLHNFCSRCWMFVEFKYFSYFYTRSFSFQITVVSRCRCRSRLRDFRTFPDSMTSFNLTFCTCGISRHKYTNHKNILDSVFRVWEKNIWEKGVNLSFLTFLRLDVYINTVCYANYADYKYKSYYCHFNLSLSCELSLIFC